MPAIAELPAAAIEEQNDRAGARFARRWDIDVQGLARMGSVGDGGLAPVTLGRDQSIDEADAQVGATAEKDRETGGSPSRKENAPVRTGHRECSKGCEGKGLNRANA